MNFDLPTLDQMTGGIFGAMTSSERTSRVRSWLESNPSAELMQAVFKELSVRDKGACRPLRERLDDMKRAKTQDALGQEWAVSAEALLALPRLNMADAMAWQRDAAKAGAPLSKEPLATLKTKLAERVAKIDEIQHQVAVQREAAALFAQRLDTLSTKPLADVLAQRTGLDHDVAQWKVKSQELTARPEWQDVDAKLPTQLQMAESQLTAIWSAFAAAMDAAQTAKVNADAPLPPIPVWADDIRAERGVAALDARVDKQSKPKIDPEKRAVANAVVQPILAKLEEELAAGHGKATAGAANNLRQVLKEQGAWIDGKLDLACHAALGAAGELEGWQRWRADQLRQNLVKQAEALRLKPLAGRKQQEAIRTLRDQWKQADQGGIPNHALWKRFDEACNESYKVVEVWLEELKARSAQVMAERTALIEQVKVWGAQQAGSTDWKSMHRALQIFSGQWRDAGHLGERDFEAMQTAWKAAIKNAAAPLDAAQKATYAQRQALIEQAKTMAEAVAAGAQLRIDFVRDLQHQWQTEAQSVPLDRKTEQKLWDTFKATIDGAFAKKDEARKAAQEAHIASLSQYDKAVLEASKQLDEASIGGDAVKIQTAMTALQTALRGQAAQAAQMTQAQAQTAIPKAEETGTAPVTPPKPLIAMRSDDRKSGKAPEPSKFNKKPVGRDGRDGRDSREPRSERAPRLSEEAFHAQRKAMEHAEVTLKKLQIQAHGEVVTSILTAWQNRTPDAIPAASALGKSVNNATRMQWTQALGNVNPAADAAVGTALLRLEMATGVPTPADYLNDRRALQLQLLTKRNDPTPQQTWAADVTKVLQSSYSEGSAKRLQANLRALLK